MMGRTTACDLTTARIRLASDLKAQTALRWVLAVALVLLAAGAALRLFADGAGTTTRRAALEEQNSALRAEAERLKAELELERATRAALDRQVVELNEQITEAERQLGFLKAQGGGARRQSRSLDPEG
jgi:septal ring factor EnvC (AmiA/AmiB activator)